MKGYNPYNHTPTQHDRILAYFKQHGSLTLLECMSRLKITKLQTRLGELRKKGYVFPERWERNGATRYKRYYAPSKTA